MRLAIFIVLFASTLVYAGANYNAAVIADSPVAWWKMNELSGTVMIDSSGNGRDGAYIDGLLGQPGIFGVGCGDTSVLFNRAGSSGQEYAEVTSNTAYNIPTTGELTVEGWARVTLIPAFRASMVFKGFRLDPSNQFEWGIDNDPGASWEWLTFQSNGASHAFAAATTPVDTSAFQHVVGTIIDGTNIKIYINGAIEDTSTSFTGTVGSGTDPVWIARRAICPAVGVCTINYMVAYIAQVAIYNTALSSTRVLAHYNAALADIAACAAVPKFHRRVYQMK